MTLTEMRYIVALARERHFGKAAEACHVSQPTLSVALKKVEGQLGAALFERSAADVRITALGERIVTQARRVLEEAVRLEEIAGTGGDPLSGPLRVGVIYSIAPYMLPQFIPALHKHAPAMPLYLKEDFTANLIPALKAGELDVIVIALRLPKPGWSRKRFMKNRSGSLSRPSIPGRIARLWRRMIWMARTCCCSATVTVSAIRCWSPVRVCRRPMRWKIHWKAVPWKPSATWWPAGRVLPSCQVRRPTP